MLNDIITEHKERMLNLKKYYPFFKLMDVSFAQFQEGRYEMLDMGYIVMGILRFFIEENNFKEKDVTYPEYLDFIFQHRNTKNLPITFSIKLKMKADRLHFHIMILLKRKNVFHVSRYWKVPSVTIRYGIPSVPMQLNSIWIRKKLKKKAESVCSSCS